MTDSTGMSMEPAATPSGNALIVPTPDIVDMESEKRAQPDTVDVEIEHILGQSVSWPMAVMPAACRRETASANEVVGSFLEDESPDSSPSTPSSSYGWAFPFASDIFASGQNGAPSSLISQGQTSKASSESAVTGFWSILNDNSQSQRQWHGEVLSRGCGCCVL